MNAPFRRFLARLLLLLAVFAPSPGALRAQTDLPSVPPTEKPAFIYRLSITDRIRVSIFQEDELNVLARIDARGNINLKLVGDLYVAGLSVNEAQRTIEDAYRNGRFLRNPQVTVTVEDYAPREVSIQGQVKAPGRYLLPVESTFSIVELVTKAGGFTDIASEKDVRVTRILPDGTRQVHEIDVGGYIRGKRSPNTAPPLLLEPGDIVYVRERII